MTLRSLSHRLVARRGRNLLQQERWQQAAAILGHAVRLDPGHWESQNNLAVALLKLGQWEAAAAVAQRAIALQPAANASHANFGIALLKMERWDEAVVAYRRALRQDPGSESANERLASALVRLGRWSEAAEAYQRAVELDLANHRLHHELGVALSVLERWDQAAVAFGRAIERTPDKPKASGTGDAGDAAPRYSQPGSAETGEPDSYAGLADVIGKLPASEAAVATLRERVARFPEDAGAHLKLGVELLKLERWQEAVEALERGAGLAAVPTSLHFLRIDPLVRLGRAGEAVTLHGRTVGVPQRGLPSLPGETAAGRFKRKRAAFWTPANLGAEVFQAERWLEALASQTAEPQSIGAGPARASGESGRARLLFVLDNDYGELTTLQYLILGQSLAQRSTLLLPDRLYAHNPNAVPGRTHRYGSLEEVLRTVDREQPAIVFLCSGYLFWDHLGFTPADLGRLIDQLRERGCRVVTADPFLGMLSKQDARTLISIDIPAAHPVWTVEQLTQTKRPAEERMWAGYSQSEQVLRDVYHLYPSYCDVAEDDVAETDARNIACFNDRLVRPTPMQRERATKPHWLFVLTSADCGVQMLFEGEAGFLDIVASKLVEALAAGRHPILIGPDPFVEQLAARMPTAEGIDILSHCPFTQFMSLLLSAEHAFYWNVVSHSLLIRLFNQLPIVLFDRGHLVRNAGGIYDRVVRWYYQGWEPPFRDHREPLTLETVTAWSEDYRRQAHRLSERFRRAPSPGQMIEDLMGRHPVREGGRSMGGEAA